MKKLLFILMMSTLTLTTHAQLVVNDVAANVSWTVQLKNILDQLGKAQEALDKVEKVTQQVSAIRNVSRSVLAAKKDVSYCQDVIKKGKLDSQTAILMNDYMSSCIRNVATSTEMMARVATSNKFNLSDSERINYLNQIATNLSTSSNKMRKITNDVNASSEFKENMKRVMK